MSFFNNIEKITYYNNKSEVVSLTEYIIFEDEKLKQKYIIFKFQNNVNQVLRKIKFEVSQFDEEGNLVETAILEHAGFEVGANENFVPKAKMKANQDCKTIKVTTLYALFERVEWEKDEFKPVEYTVEEFRGDFAKKAKKPKKAKVQTEQTVKEKKQKPVKEKKVSAKKQKKLDKRTIVIKNVTKKNLTVSPKVWTIIFSILLFAFVIGTSFIYKGKANQFYDNGFEYTYVNDSEVVITDYDNKDKDVIIPESVDDLKVTSISDNAFENCTITSVKFTTSISVGKSAFKNCKNLSTISGANLIVNLEEHAFKNCTSLTEVVFGTAEHIAIGAFEGCSNLVKADLPVAVLAKEVFKGCTSLRELNCLDTEEQFYKVFGNAEDVPASFTTLTIGKTIFTKGYFEHMSSVESLDLKAQKPTFQYGSLIGIGLSKDKYEYNKTMEVLDGKVISYNSSDNYSVLHFPASVSDIAAEIEKLGNITENVQELRIATPSTQITNELMSRFSNLRILYYVSGVPYSNDAFTSNHNLTVLKLSTSDNHYGGLGMLLPNVNEVIVEGYQSVYPSMFNNNLFSFGQISHLTISDTVNGVSSNALSTLNNLQHLTIPNFENVTLEKMGVAKTLGYLELINLEANESLNNNYIADYDYLHTISLPTNVKVVGTRFISDCDSITYLELPQSVKETKGFLIHNCANFSQLILNEGLEIIGNSLISGCYNVNTLNIPSTVTTIGKNLLSDCGTIEYLYIPDVKEVTLPLIGVGVVINKLDVPFVGTTVNNAVKYSQFNSSYYDTNEIKIRNGFDAVDYMFEGANNLYKFECSGEIENISKGFFLNCYNLNKLELSGSFNANLSDIFGITDKYFDYLVISSTELEEDFFSNCKFEVLMIKELDVVRENQFNNMYYCDTLYLTLEGRCVLDYSTLAGKVANIYSDGKLTNEVYENIPAGSGNYAQSDFYNNYILTR